MATSSTQSGLPQSIGFVVSITGSATARGADGVIRVLQMGDAVYADDRIETGDMSVVVISFIDGTRLDLGRNAQAVLDSEVFDAEGLEMDAGEVATSVEALQQAILAGEDPTATQQAPAAGAGEGAADEGGFDFVQLDLTGQRVTPDSGFETTGLGVEFQGGGEELLFDGPTPTITLAAVDLGIGGGVVPEGTPVRFGLSLSNPSGQDITVDVLVSTGSDDTATEVVDYASQVYTVTIPAGQTGATFDVDTNDDNLFESAETFSAQIIGTAGGPAFFDTTPAMGTIVDDDTPTATVGTGLSGGSAVEGDPVVFDVSLSNPSSEDVTLNVRVFSGVTDTASEGVDYAARDYVVTIPAGSTTASFAVDTVDDALFEGTEVFSAQITEVLAGTANIDAGVASGTILDNDVPTVSVAGVDTGLGGGTAVEGNPVTFEVSISNPSTQDITVDVNVFTGAGDTATETTDYASQIYSVTIPSGSTSATFTVDTVADGVFEGAETFSAQVAGITAGTANINATPATGTILDGDSVPTVGIAGVDTGLGDGTAVEGNPVTFAVSLSTPSAVDTTLQVNVFTGGGNTATAGADYASQVVTVTIPAGSTSATFDVGTFDDTLLEGAETFSAQIIAVTSGTATINTSPATGTIIDNDVAAPPPPPPPPPVDNQPDAVNDSASTNVGIPVTVGVLGNDDLGDTPSGVGSVTQGTNGTVVINPDNTVTYTPNPGFSGNDSFTYTLTDNDGDSDTATVNVIVNPPPTVSLSGGSALEGDSVTLTVSLDNPSSEAITVDVTVFSGGSDTATEGTDYTAQVYTVTIPAGSSSATFGVPTVGDNVFEGNETFSGQITAVTSGTANIDPTVATNTIIDNDTPVVSVTGGQAVEGEPVTLTVNLTNTSTEDVTVDVTVFSGGSDTATEGTDYAAQIYSVTVPAGSTSATFTVDTVEDPVFEGNETFSAQITAVTSGTANIDSTVAANTIIDDDGAPTVNINDITINEAGETSASFTITLSNPAAENVSVGWSLSDVDATLGTDYTGPTSGTAVIPAGATTATVSIPGPFTAIDDSVFEGNETFQVNLTSVSGGGATIGDGLGLGTILDNDAPTVSVSGGSATEGNAITFTVTQSVVSDQPTQVTVNVFTGGGNTAIQGSDYAATASYNVTIPAGSPSATFTVDTLTDALMEGSETFSAQIVSASNLNGTVNINMAVATGTILDDSSVQFDISAQPGSISEDLEQSALFTISLSGDILTGSNTASVTVTGAGSATDGTDYDPALATALSQAAAATPGAAFNSGTGVLTFDSGFGGSLNFALQAQNDQTVEGTETAQVNLSGATATGGGATIGTPSASVNITEVDQAVQFSVSATPDSISEEGAESATFTISFTGGPLNGSNTASVTVAGAGSATGGADYSPTLASSLATEAAATTGVSFDSNTGVLTFDSTAPTSISFDVQATDDSVPDNGETVQVSLSNAAVTNGMASVASGGDTATVTISDVDQTVVFSVSADPGSISEEGTESATFTISFTGGPLNGSNTASVTVAGAGSATGGADYSPTLASSLATAAAATTGVSFNSGTGVLTFDSTGPNSIDFGVAAIDDSDVEGTETIQINLSGAAITNGTATIDTGTATVNITETDTPPPPPPPNAPPVADPVLTSDDDVPDVLVAGLGSVWFFKALDVGGGLDGDLTVFEPTPDSDPADLGGQDAETTEPNLDFMITSLPSYGHVYVDFADNDPTGGDWVEVTSTNINTLTFTTQDNVYFVANSADELPGDPTTVTVGGTNTLASWNGVQLFARRLTDGDFSTTPNQYVATQFESTSGARGIGVQGGRYPEVDYFASQNASEALQVVFDAAVSTADVTFALFYGGENGGEQALVTAYDLQGNQVGQMVVTGAQGETYGPGRPGLVTHTVSFGQSFSALTFEALPNASGNGDNSDFLLNQITYTGEAFPDDVSFEYKVTDEAAQDSTPVTVQIGLSDPGPVLGTAPLDMATQSAAALLPPQPPEATDDTAVTDEDMAVLIDVLDNDSDPDGTVDPTSVAITGNPSNGTVSVDAQTGAVTYTPDADFHGSDSFTYTVEDDEGQGSNQATVEVTVRPQPEAIGSVDFITNTSNNNSGSDTGQQQFTIILRGPSGEIRTVDTTPAQGGEPQSLDFVDASGNPTTMELSPNETYTLSIKYVSGSNEINFRSMGLYSGEAGENITEPRPNPAVVVNQHPGGGDDVTISSGGSTGGYDGVVYTLSVDGDGDIQLSGPTVGYGLDQGVLTLNSTGAQQSFALDFSDLPLGDISADLVDGVVNEVDVTGGSNENNVVTLTAGDVLDLGGGGPHTLVIDSGDRNGGDSVNLRGSWTAGTPDSNGLTPYTSGDATVLIDTNTLDVNVIA